MPLLREEALIIVPASLEERPNSLQARLAECNVSAKMRLKKLGVPITQTL